MQASKVNMEYFPFDTQRCPLKYGSWAYSQKFIKLQHLTVTNGILGEVNRASGLEGSRKISLEIKFLRVPKEK